MDIPHLPLATMGAPGAFPLTARSSDGTETVPSSSVASTARSSWKVGDLALWAPELGVQPSSTWGGYRSTLFYDQQPMFDHVRELMQRNDLAALQSLYAHLHIQRVALISRLVDLQNESELETQLHTARLAANGLQENMRIGQQAIVSMQREFDAGYDD